MEYKFEWDLTHLFKNDDEWTKTVKLLKYKIDVFNKALNDNISNDDDKFNGMIKDKIEIDALIEQVYCYPRRFLDLGSDEKSKKGMLNLALNIYAEIQELSTKFEASIINNIEKIKVDEHYKRYIDLIVRKREHIVSKEQSNILGEFSKKNNMLKKIYQSLVERDMKFGKITDENGKEVALTRLNYQDFSASKDIAVRKNAFCLFTKSYENINSTLASLYEYKIQTEIELSKLENYKSFLSKKLFIDKIPTEIINNLLDTLDKNILIGHQYIEFKKNQLKLEEFHIYDSSLSLGEVTSIKKPIEEAIEMIKKSLQILGIEYLNKIDIAFNNGWIDVFPKDKKRKMSYSCISYFGVPYTLLNYEESFNSIRTLAHELGHAIHTDYAKKQRFEYFEYSLFLAEIASKVNELLFNNYTYENATTDEEKIYILNSEIASLGNTLFGQSMITEFEHSVFKKKENGESIDADYLNNLYYEIFKKYNGDSIVYDDEIKYGWSKIPHLFMNESYYVYQYAIGVCIAGDIVTKLLTNSNYVQKYIEFMKTGNSLDIANTLKIIDIDLEKPEYIQNTFDYLDRKIQQIKRLTKKQ